MDDLKQRRLARSNLEELATRCLPAACMALGREAQFDADFDWTRAGRLSVDVAVAIRSRAAELTATMDDEKLAVLAEQVLRGDLGMVS